MHFPVAAMDSWIILPPPPVCTSKWLLYSTMHKVIVSHKTPSQYTSILKWHTQQSASGPHPQPDESRPNFSVYFLKKKLFNIILLSTRCSPISYLSHTCHYLPTILMSFPMLP